MCFKKSTVLLTLALWYTDIECDVTNMPTVLIQLVLVFGSFVLHFLSTGISQSFGVMYSELVSVFEIGEGEIGFVASLFTGLLLGTGECFDLHQILDRVFF